MKVQLIYNPVAGPRDVTAELREVMAFLASHGWQVSLRQTLGLGDATTYAREAVANGCDMVVAVGGDGTLGEVASGLAGSDCVLGVLPVGTGNVWAHMVGLPVWTPLRPSALMEAAQILLDGRERRIDLGQAGKRYFVLWAGIGFDAEVAQGVEPYREIRRSLGNLPYIVTVVVLSLGLRGTRTTVVIDGRAMRQRAFLILVSNAQLYGSSWMVAPQAQLDDGWFDVHIFKGGSILDVVRHILLILLQKQRQDPKLETYRARRVEIRSAKPLPLQLDGDPVGYTPVTITVVPRALRVIVPSWAPASLFAEVETTSGEQPSLTQRIADHLRSETEHLRAEGERLRQDLERRLRLPPSG